MIGFLFIGAMEVRVLEKTKGEEVVEKEFDQGSKPPLLYVFLFGESY